MIYSNNGLLAAGSNKKIISYSEQGRILQEFDYGDDEEEKDFTTVILDPIGNNAIFGSFNRFVLK